MVNVTIHEEKEVFISNTNLDSRVGNIFWYGCALKDPITKFVLLVCVFLKLSFRALLGLQQNRERGIGISHVTVFLPLSTSLTGTVLFGFIHQG